MQLDFSEEQKELGASVRRFFEKECPSSVVREVMSGEAPFPAGLWAKLGEQGFLAAAIPEQYGGVGAGYLELCIVARECGRALAPVPTVSSIYLAAEFLLAAGSEAQRTQWLPRLASGVAIGTLALGEGPGEASPANIRASVAGGRLSGSKVAVLDGAAAELGIVMARGEDGAPALFLADLTGSGVNRTPVNVIDQSRKAARIDFDGAPVEPLGQAGQGFAILDAVRDRAAVLVAFEQIGGAEAALDMACGYARDRYAFGRQIGSFQAIKHMLADCYVAIELARSNCYYGAWALSAGSDRLAAAAAHARVASTIAFQQTSANTVQTHGGMGFTWEFDCHLYYRRSNALALLLGGQSFWEDRLVGAIRPQAA